jgi:hypothetical protein
MRRWLMLLGLCTTFVAAPRKAAAAPDVPVYVSDQFKTVARRTLTQITSEAIANACPNDQPLCGQVVGRLGEAFGAAISKDDVALRAALNSFFVDSSVSALLQVTVADVLHEEALAGQVGKGLYPVLRCLAATVAGRAARSECTMSEADRGYMTSLFQTLYPNTTNNDILSAWTIAYKDGSLNPADLLIILDTILRSPQIQRPDLAIYVDALQDWIQRGLGRGLVDPTYEFLSNLRAETVRRTILMYGEPTALGSAVWDLQYNQKWRDAAARCKLDPTPIDAWVAVRESAMARLRVDLLRARSPDTVALEGLLRVQPRCADPTLLSSILEMRRHVRYILGAVRLLEAGTYYGVAALAGTAIVDFVRDPSDTQLEKSLRAILVYGLAPLTLGAVNTPLVAAGSSTFNFRTVRDILRSCEFRGAEAHLGLPAPKDAPGDVCPAQCLSLADAGAAPGAYLCKDVPMQVDVSGDVKLGLKLLQAIFDKWIAASPNLQVALSTAHIDALAQALSQLQAGDVTAARKALLRLGIDELVEQVDVMSTEFLGVSEASCATTVRERWITGMSSGCAAHLLIRSAYHPIADYYWEHGISEKDVPAVAQGVYRELLSTPYLDYTPLILNLGLGATYISGNANAFGTHGYGALTVLDKFGLAIYKYSGPVNRFEAGFFAGGFLDALVRTLANEGKSERYWLLGAAAGWPRLFKLDLGFEAHFGAAMPFDLTSNHYGFATGGAFVIPFNYLFDEGK